MFHVKHFNSKDGGVECWPLKRTLQDVWLGGVLSTKGTLGLASTLLVDLSELFSLTAALGKLQGLAQIHPWMLQIHHVHWDVHCQQQQ